MQKDLSRFVRVAGACLVMGTLACVAMAQDSTLRPPAPLKEDSPSFFMPILAALVIIAASIGANLIPSKRGHQD